MKSTGTPYLLDPSQGATKLKRLRLGDRSIRESDLQEMLARNPELLPISRLDDSFAPAISLGREIMGIDNLFMAPTGRLTIVETKLWRNPQAVREVLAQIVDYASKLASLDYERFEQACRTASGSPVEDAGLFGLATRHFPDEQIDEARFIDRITQDLRNGRFLLLVVGDGIRDGLERMLGALHHQSHLHFTFGLVELKIYSLPTGDGMVVIPSVVAHSTEVERAVVTIRGGQPDQVEVAVSADPRQQAPKLTESEFLESIEDPDTRLFGERLFQWARQRGWIEITKRGDSASIRVPFSTTRAGLILLRLFKDGKVLTTPPRLRRVLRKNSVGQGEVVRLAQELKKLVPEIQIQSDKERVARAISASQLLPHHEAVFAVYDEAIERLKNLDPDLETPSNEEDTDEDL